MITNLDFCQYCQWFKDVLMMSVQEGERIPDFFYLAGVLSQYILLSYNFPRTAKNLIAKSSLFYV